MRHFCIPQRAASGTLSTATTQASRNAGRACWPLAVIRRAAIRADLVGSVAEKMRARPQRTL
jgi:hypothetical protein